MRKNKMKWLGVLILSFVVALILMGVVIYFGYTEAYQTGVEELTVKIIGIPIYQLSKNGTTYVGETIGIYMGFFSGICMALGLIVSFLWEKLRRK